jgi:hypothetical protein
LVGKLAIEEIVEDNKRTITFSPIFKRTFGTPYSHEIWATNIKEF